MKSRGKPQKCWITSHKVVHQFISNRQEGRRIHRNKTPGSSWFCRNLKMKAFKRAKRTECHVLHISSLYLWELCEGLSWSPGSPSTKLVESPHASLGYLQHVQVKCNPKSSHLQFLLTTSVKGEKEYSLIDLHFKLFTSPCFLAVLAKQNVQEACVVKRYKWRWDELILPVIHNFYKSEENFHCYHCLCVCLPKVRNEPGQVRQFSPTRCRLFDKWKRPK